MADKVKLPVIGPTNKVWVYAGGALIAGFVGYAWWTRARPGEGVEELEEEAIPQERTPPPTVVGSEDFDDENVRAIINTNPEWYVAAVEYLSTTGGYDFTTVTLTLGKFLARRQLTEAEANIVQAAKGAVGEPPQGGPWPIIRVSVPTGAPQAGAPKPLVGWHGTRLTQPITLQELARKYSRYPDQANSVEGTRRQIIARNPFLTATGKNKKTSVLPKGWIIIVPMPDTRKVA